MMRVISMRIDSFELLDINNNDFNINDEKAIFKDGKIILSAGKYVFSLNIQTDEKNQGDMLSVCLNGEAVRFIKIPVGLEAETSSELTFVIKEVTELSLVNESDDYLIYKRINGGLYMSEPLQIINFSNFNPFSFDLQLNTDFSEDIDVKVYEIGETITELTAIPVKIVDKLNLRNPENSTEQNPALKTVIYDESAVATPSYFKFDTEYKVEVYRGSELTSGIYKFTTDTFPMMNETNCTVKSYGTRLLVIEFDYPVQNLDAEIVDGTTDADMYRELNNFYISYDNKDVPISINNQKWLGNIDIQKPYVASGTTTTYVTYPFSYVVSPDRRRFEIQFNLGNFNTASVNKLTVNYTVNPDYEPAYRLKDFSGRELASFSKDFICYRETAPASIIPNSIEAVSNHELKVTFDNPVCTWLPKEVGGTDTTLVYLDYFKQYGYFELFNILPEGETKFKVLNVDRVGNGFNTILYTLDYTADNIMPVPEATVKVGKVLDASGLDTVEEIATIEVPSTQPRFINAYQNAPVGIQTNTQIVIVFNEKMTTGAGENSAENKANYQLVDPSGKVIDLTPNNVTLNVIPGKGDMEYLLTIPYVLPSGIYKLTAYDTIEDFTGVKIVTETRPIQILDYVSPGIEKIIATVPVAGNTDMTDADNSMIIMFDREMNVGATSAHSALDGDNYLMQYTETTVDDSSYILDDTTLIENIYNDRWIRYTLPVNQEIPIFVKKGTDDANKIHIGYVQGQKIFYITSKSGNIYPLCTIAEIDEFVEPLTIAAPAATSEVKNDNQISVKINNPINSYIYNLFGNLDIADFAASVDNGVTFDKKPVSAQVGPYPFDTAIFTFEPGIFNSSQPIQLKVISDSPKSTDIFGKPIVSQAVSTVVNNIPTALKSISLIDVDYAASSALIELLFEKSVSNYKVTDFYMVYNNGTTVLPLNETATGVPVPSLGGTRPNTVQISVKLPTISDEILRNIYVSMSTSTIIGVGIRDINGKPIETFSNVNAEVSSIKVNSYAWNYIASDGTANEYYEIRMKMSEAFLDQYMGIVADGAVITTTPDATNKNVVSLVLSAAASHVGKFEFVLDPQYTYADAYINEWKATVSTDSLNNEIIVKLEPTGAAPSATLFDTAQITGGTDTFSADTSRISMNYIPFINGAVDNAYIVNKDDTMQLFRIVPFGTVVK